MVIWHPFRDDNAVYIRHMTLCNVLQDRPQPNSIEAV